MGGAADMHATPTQHCTHPPTLKNVQCDCPYSNTDHALRVGKELDGLGQQGEVPQVLQKVVQTVHLLKMSVTPCLTSL